ncbi:MAG: MFS transporter [Dehalococcoidia bacterium]
MAARVRTGLFYGWYIVLVALVAQFIAGGTQIYAIGVFLKPMTEELGWSRESFSAVQTVSTVVMGISGLAIGGLLDRRGPRMLLLLGGVIAGASLCAIGAVHELWQFYLLRGVGQTLGAAMMGNLVVNVTVAKWFVARRGMAISMASLGISLGGVLLAPLISVITDAYGWRSAWVLLGVMVWVLIIPSAFVIRATPEQYGLTPDGLSPEEALAYTQRKRRASAATEVQWTRSEAIRTPTIWMVITAYGLGGIGLGALFLHLIPFLTDQGFGRSTAAVLFGSQAWASLLAKPVWGALMDRFHARFLSAAGFTLTAGSIALMIPAASTGSLWLTGLVLFVYGFGVGGVVPLQETVWASYFGRLHLGEIRSVGMPFSIIFGAGGPLFAGTLYDHTGSYAIAFASFSVVQLLGVVLLLLARAPTRPGSTTTASAVQEPTVRAV